MPFGIRPSNVRVCHSTTRASRIGNFPQGAAYRKSQRRSNFVLLIVIEITTRGVKVFEHEHEHEHE